MAVQQNKKSTSKRGNHRAHDFLSNPATAVERAIILIGKEIINFSRPQGRFRAPAGRKRAPGVH